MNSVEINTLPDGWILKPLGDIAFLKSGSTPRRSNNSFWNKGTIPWLKSGELNDVIGIKENSEFITDKALVETSVKLFEKDTLLIAMYGATAGKLGILSINATTNQAVCSIQNIYNKFDNHYIFYFLLSSRQEIIQDSFGGAQPNISKSYLEKITIPLPSLEEQKRIVAKIDTLFTKIDKAISLTEESLKQAENLLPSLLKEVFEKGKADGWEEKELKDICTIINGRAYKKTELLSQGKYRVLRVGNLFTNNSWYWSDLELKEDKYISNGDLIYAWSASFGPRVWNGEKVIYHYHIWKIVNRAEVSKDFLYNWLDWKTDTIKKENTSGATMIHVTKGMMESLIIQYPNINTQEQIVKSIEKLNKNFIETQSKLEEQLAYLKQLKSSILSKAFKGEL